MIKYLWIPVILVTAAIFVVIKRHNLSSSASSEELVAKDILINNTKQFSGCFQPLADATQENNAFLTQKLIEMWKKRSTDLPAISEYLDAICNSEQDILRHLID